MIRKDQAIRHNDISSPARRKHHNLSNILWSQRLTSTVVDESQSQHKGQVSDEENQTHEYTASALDLSPPNLTIENSVST
jgi:hypothetical protein